MPWIILLASSVLEAVWAIALSESDGLTRPIPTVIFVGAATLSMLGLAFAMKSIPTSVAYAVWVGVGAAITVTVSMMTGIEDFSALKALLLAGIIACVIGLKFAPDRAPQAAGVPCLTRQDSAHTPSTRDGDPI